MRTRMMRFLHNEYRLEETHPDYRKTYLLNVTFLLFIATCLAFAGLNLFLVECLENPWFLVGAAVAALFAQIFFHRTGNIERSANLLIGLLIFSLLIYFHAVQNKNFGLYWMVSVPPISYFLLGEQKARRISILFFAYVFFFIWTGQSQWSPAEFNTQSLLNISGSTLGLVLLVSYHERSRKEAAEALQSVNDTLKESKEDLQLILNTAGEGMFGIDTKGICTFCNARGLELLGYQNITDLTGHEIHYMIHYRNTDREPLHGPDCPILKTVASGEKTHSDKDAFRRYDGSLFEVEYHSYPKYQDGVVVGAVVTFNDISGRRRDEMQIAYLSRHDLLTGLRNRQQLEEDLAACDCPAHLPVSVVYADLDGLKLTNDIFGHDAGDDFLRKAAEILLSSSEKGDLLARVGGDEFVWLMPNTDQASAARKMLLARSRLESQDRVPVRCSISMGCATKCYPREEMAQIYKDAENAMYRNKASRKKGYEKAALHHLTELLHQRCPGSGIHARNTSRLCESMARSLCWTAADVRCLRDAGYYHDIGKIVLLPDLLNKTSPLTPTEEYEKQQHPVAGYRIMNLFDHTLDLGEAIYSHHEKWDGSGYPKGLKGVEIPIQSRIIALAEQYDHLRNRTAKPALDPEKAGEHIRSLAGIHYDPDLVPLFLEAARTLEEKESDPSQR